MADRKRCVFCRRGIATDEDWEANATLPSDREDAEAERLGLTKLCWEQEDESCLGLLADSGRPTNLEAALAQHDALYLAVQKEVEWFRERAEHFGQRWNNSRLGTELRASERGAQVMALAAVDRLQRLFESEGSGE
jgi:hypothetical protein